MTPGWERASRALRQCERGALGDPWRGERERGRRTSARPLILCYHKVEPRRELGVTRLSPLRFARQIERLARAGWRVLGAAELRACLRGEREAAPRELAITFDDGYRGLRTHAFPVLEAHGFGALCFVITGYTGRLNRWDVAYGGRRFAHLTWRDMRRWQERGITFGSHTVTHPRLTWLSADAAAHELRQSRAAITAALDEAPWAVSYPFGAAGARERALSRQAGFEAGFALASGSATDRFAVPRLPVYCWSPPRPAIGVAAPLEWLAAAGAGHCAVGTTLWQRARAPRTATPRTPR